MMSKKDSRALVVGLGVTGISAALRLSQAGWHVTVVEKAPERRRGGYFVALFGAGQAAAERLGIVDQIGDRTVRDAATYFVDRDGARRQGMGFADLPDARMILRGDIEQAGFDALPAEVEIRYSTVPVALTQDATGVELTLRNTDTEAEATERYDLLVGADGLRSTVRSLLFPEGKNKLHRLNMMIGAAALTEQVPCFEQNQGLMLAEPGRSAWVFAFNNRPPTVLFSYRTHDVDAEFQQSAIESIRAAYGPEAPGPVLGPLMDQFEVAPDYLFDSVEQVHQDRWHDGRVVLVGDAAWCLTLYSGMGASSGLTGADLLGSMLERHADVPSALADWERRMRPFIANHMQAGRKNRAFFTPESRTEFAMRNAMRIARQIPVAGRLLGKLQTHQMTRLAAVDLAA